MVSLNRPCQRSRGGAILILVVLLMTGFAVAIGFSINIAYMQMVRTELRSGTDAAAKAAALELSMTQNVEQARRRGIEIAAANRVAGRPLTIAGDQLVFGRSTREGTGPFQFRPGVQPFNSVQVTPQLSVGLPLDRIFSIDRFLPRQEAVATFLERDVVLVIDRSGSMAGGKFRDLVSAIDVFITTLDQTPSEEQVGLASYSTSATSDEPITSQTSRVSQRMHALSANGFTAIGEGMRAGHRIFQTSGRSRQFVERTMIVMTDGLHNTSIPPEGPAAEIRADGITIHTITFGSDADQPRMRNIARVGSGQHFHASNGLQLREVYRQIALTLPTMLTH